MRTNSGAGSDFPGNSNYNLINFNNFSENNNENIGCDRLDSDLWYQKFHNMRKEFAATALGMNSRHIIVLSWHETDFYRQLHFRHSKKKDDIIVQMMILRPTFFTILLSNRCALELFQRCLRRVWRDLIDAQKTMQKQSFYKNSSQRRSVSGRIASLISATAAFSSH